LRHSVDIIHTYPKVQATSHILQQIQRSGIIITVDETTSVTKKTTSENKQSKIGWQRQEVERLCNVLKLLIPTIIILLTSIYFVVCSQFCHVYMSATPQYCHASRLGPFLCEIQ